MTKYTDKRQALSDLINMKSEFSDMLKSINDQIISGHNTNEYIHSITIDDKNIVISTGKHDYRYCIVRYIVECLDKEIKDTNEKMNKIANKIIEWRNK